MNEVQQFATLSTVADTSRGPRPMVHATIGVSGATDSLAVRRIDFTTCPCELRSMAARMLEAADRADEFARSLDAPLCGDSHDDYGE